MSRVRRVSAQRAAAIATLLAAGLAVTPLRAAEVSNFTDASYYPSKVKALHFNYTIDESSSMTWGAWSVGFGAVLPTATMNSWANGGAISIAGLKCSNSVAGSTSCTFRMWFGENVPDQGSCRFDVDAAGSSSALIFPVACPRSLEFQ